MNDLTFASAHQLAQMIRDRQVSAVEVIDAHLAKISRHNAQLNAICTLDAENARTRAQEADLALDRGENWGVLHGVPVTIKDIFETAGLRTTAGYIPLKDYIPQQDATIVARLRSAGAIILGKTNMAELAGDFQSTNSLFPRVNNPWHLDYTAGGSSGGSAAAIAAGFSALDLGNDFSGSIRQPAHFCGVYGLKPTDRRISTAGAILFTRTPQSQFKRLFPGSHRTRSIHSRHGCSTRSMGCVDLSGVSHCGFYSSSRLECYRYRR